MELRAGTRQMGNSWQAVLRNGRRIVWKGPVSANRDITTQSNVAAGSYARYVHDALYHPEKIASLMQWATRQTMSTGNYGYEYRDALEKRRTIEMCQWATREAAKIQATDTQDAR